MAILQPPCVNGEMTLTNTQITSITSKLVAIREAFVADDFQTVCTTQYITSKYNDANTFKINGDTCEVLLAEHDKPTEVI